MTLLRLCCCIFTIALTPGPASTAQNRRTSISVLVGRMLTNSEQFQARQLHAHGPTGLEAALNRMFPDSTPLPKSDIAKVKRLAKQLRSKRFQVRQKASDQLIAIGPPVRRYLAQISRDAPLEVVRRVKIIMDASGQVDDVADDLRGFTQYIRGIKDAAGIRLLTERVAASLESGMPKSSRREALKLCLAVVGRNNVADRLSVFKSLLTHRDVGMIVFALDEIGSNVRFSSSFPELLVDALSNENQRVIEAALRWSPECVGKPCAKRVERTLRRIFHSRNVVLKFQVSFPLMYAFGDTAAWEFILSQTQNRDRDRALKALCWLGDERNRSKKATPQLIANLSPLLTSNDIAVRLSAIKALSTYRGNDVVRQLLPLLRDKNEIVARMAAAGLRAAMAGVGGRRCLFRHGPRQEIVEVSSQRPHNALASRNGLKSVLLTSSAAYMDVDDWDGVIPRAEESLIVHSTHGVKQHLDATRAVSRIAKNQLWLALNENDETARDHYAKLARKTALEVGTRYEHILRNIENLQKAFDNLSTPSTRLLMKGLDDVYARTLLERGLTYLDQAHTNIRYQEDERQNLQRARCLGKACKIFRQLTEHDAGNPMCWLGVAWLMHVSQLVQDPNEAHRLFPIIQRNKKKVAVDARRIADYFFLVGIMRNPAYARLKQLVRVRAKQKCAEQWPYSWPGYMDTPFGWAVRYQLAIAYYMESEFLAHPIRYGIDKKTVDAQRRELVLRMAERLFIQIAPTPSEFARIAGTMALVIHVRENRTRTVGQNAGILNRINVDPCDALNSKERGK